MRRTRLRRGIGLRGMGRNDAARLIVGATLAGFDATPDNLINLVALARALDAAATSAGR